VIEHERAGQRECGACSRRRADRRRRRVADAIARAACSYCHGPLDRPGKDRCTTCKDRILAAELARRAAGHHPPSHVRRADRWRAWRRERNALLRRAGFCTRCGAPLDAERLAAFRWDCAPCSAARTAANARRRLAMDV
jgi:hypothetical protein